MFFHQIRQAVPKVANGAAAGLFAVTMLAANLTPTFSNKAYAWESNPDGQKAYICKYTGKPGVDEVLQTGKKPD